jgi:hypothetical protein
MGEEGMGTFCESLGLLNLLGTILLGVKEYTIQSRVTTQPMARSNFTRIGNDGKI